MRFALILLLTLPLQVFSQHEFMQWTNLGVKKKITKDLDLFGELNFRFGDRGLNTFFPQVGARYEITKWFKPSVEYRYVLDKNIYTNYESSHRFNFNANFKHDVERFDFGLRVRYQYSFNTFSSSEYDSDFDQAVRFKPTVTYDIKNFILSPKASVEFFYNPAYGPKGRQLDKMRYAIGAGLDLNNDHDISFKYQIDTPLDNPTKDIRHVFAVSYEFSF